MSSISGTFLAFAPRIHHYLSTSISEKFSQTPQSDSLTSSLIQTAFAFSLSGFGIPFMLAKSQSHWFIYVKGGFRKNKMVSLFKNVLTPRFKVCFQGNQSEKLRKIQTTNFWYISDPKLQAHECKMRISTSQTTFACAPPDIYPVLVLCATGIIS